MADTFAFGWSRTEVDPRLLELLADPQWQPYLVFPGEYVAAERVVNEVAPQVEGKRPLFILLDATWTEARKMFRQESLPGAVPGAQPAARAARAIACVARPVASTCAPPKWRRCAWSWLATRPAGEALGAYLEVFSERYLGAKRHIPLTRPARRTVPWRRSVAECQAGRASAASLRGHNCATSMPASISAQPK